jgi:toxoflavin synthase
MDYNKDKTELYKKIRNEFTLASLSLNTFYKLIYPKIDRKSVLDFACGEGYLTRRLKIWGAGEILGIDASESMINLAKEQEKRSPLGIEYELHSAQKLGTVGVFDIITASWLLANAKDETDLEKMISSIALNCKKKTKFYSIDHCGIFERYGNKLLNKYNMNLDSIVKTPGYIHIKITLTGVDNSKMTFDNTCFERKLLETKMHQYGFRNIKWHKIEFAGELIPFELHKIWQDIGNESIVEILEATYEGC